MSSSITFRSKILSIGIKNVSARQIKQIWKKNIKMTSMTSFDIKMVRYILTSLGILVLNTVHSY